LNPTRAEIDLNKLEYNYNRIKKHLQKNNTSRKRVKICGVVKANAYGHGIQEISQKLISIGADYLGVANYDEAIKLRTTIPEASILVFGTLIHSKLKPAAYVKRLLKNDLIATVASLETARFLDYYSKRIGKKFKVHIKVDTGMKRIGFDVKWAFKNISQVFAYKNLDIEGIYTHFATSESDIHFAKSQLHKFQELLQQLKKAGMEFPIVHAANSGAVLDLKDSYFDMVRPGLILYGYYPSDSNIKKIPLKPVMNLKSKVTYIKRVEPNTSISYGRDYYTETRSFIGSIPIGYGDGYWRAFSNRAKVFINGKLYPIVGNISMDWLMVNLGEKSNVRVGDDVLLMGNENGFEIGADKLARMTKTIPYEICCAVADRVQRVYVEEKK
jgi:alanine racemase